MILCAAALLAGCEDKTPPTWEGDGLLEATVEGTSIRLAWPVANENDALKEHRILKDGSEIATVGGDVREYLIEDLDDATTYELTVEAVDQSGNRSEPLHATATTADETGPHWVAGAALRVADGPAPETGLAPAVLEWDRAEDSSGVTGYKIMAGQTELATVAGLRYELGRPLAPGERETLSVIATDDAGNESAPLRWRATPAEDTTTTVAQGEPQAPEAQLQPTARMPAQSAPSVNLDPAQAAIVERIRRLGEGIRRPLLDRSALMLEETKAQ